MRVFLFTLDAIRTHDLPLRRRLLYPAELPGLTFLILSRKFFLASVLWNLFLSPGYSYQKTSTLVSTSFLQYIQQTLPAMRLNIAARLPKRHIFARVHVLPSLLPQHTECTTAKRQEKQTP